ncbi:MAG: nucleoside phosphorylase, partial [Rhodospirillaceae bacterium]
GAREKEALFWSDGVAALDMESGAVARAAIGASLPFMALRAILDPADAGIPPAALAGVDADGRTHVAAVIAAVFRRPQDIAPLLRVAGAHRNATGALARAAAAAAPLFGAV